MFPTIARTASKQFTVAKLLKTLIKITVGIILIAYFLALFPQLFRYKDFLLESNFKVIMVLIALVVLSWMNYVFFSSKHSNVIGSLILENDRIVINDEIYPVDDLKHIRFIGNDIMSDFRGFLSDGQNNHLILTRNNGEVVDAYFQQTKKNRLKDQKGPLKGYLEKNLMSKANFDAIMNNTNYY